MTWLSKYTQTKISIVDDKNMNHVLDDSITLFGLEIFYEKYILVVDCCHQNLLRYYMKIDEVSVKLSTNIIYLLMTA
jgi:hypothetical protein